MILNENKLIDREVFCKIIPILEPLYFIKNNYNNLYIEIHCYLKLQRKYI